MMADSPQLVVIKGPEMGRTFHLDEPTLVIGRHPRSGIVIDHPEVSRRHARIVRQEEGWIVEDLDSTNGTFLNGARLTGPRELSPGDTVGLSEAVTLTFRRKPAAQPVPPAEEAWGPAAPSSPPRGRPAPTRPPTQHRREAPAAPASYRAGTPAPTQGGPDRTLLWIGAGCVVLLLIAVCAAVLLLAYLDVIPSLFGGVPPGPGLAPPVGL
jgi:hypothetical protein